jgi:uncharacterized protein YpuA (DUF1002 family)
VTGAASLAVAVGAFVMLSERGARDIPNAQAQPSPSVIVYGGDLSDADRQQVAATLGLPPAATQTVSHQELVNALSAEDISVAPTDAALSSVELTCDPAGSGLRVSTRDIAGLAPSEYALALVTAGLYDASAVVVAPPDKGVSGETAVVGALKALPTCLGGMAPDSHRTQLSYQQLKVTEDIAGSSGSDLSSSSSLLLQLVNDTLSSQPVDDAAITTEAASHGITLNDATRTEISQLLAELRQLDWSSYSHGIVVEDNGPNAVRLTPAR